MSTVTEPTSSLGSPSAPSVNQRAKRPWWKYEITAEKVKPEEVMNFSRQCSAFVRSGIPLIEALEIISKETRDKLLQKILLETAERIRSGSKLSEALALYSKALPNYYIPMIRAAELTGRLDMVLDQLAAYLDRDIESRRKIKSALTYPSIVGVLAVGVVIILAGFVLPRFESFFDGLNAKLPLATRMLLTGTRWINHSSKFIAMTLVLLIIGIAAALKTHGGKLLRDKMMLRIPGLGIVLQFAIVERFCRILSSMVQAGVPLPDAMQVANLSSKNLKYRSALDEARTSMLQGQGLADPIARSGVFPSGANQMIRVGEATGTLDAQLDSAADYYSRELNYRLKKFTDLFEPAIILAVGIVVGFVAIALVSAMYGIYRQVNV